MVKWQFPIALVLVETLLVALAMVPMTYRYLVPISSSAGNFSALAVVLTFAVGFFGLCGAIGAPIGYLRGRSRRAQNWLRSSIGQLLASRPPDITGDVWMTRFSIRTLLILVSLIGLYFGCWEVTKRWGVESVKALRTFRTRANESVEKIDGRLPITWIQEYGYLTFEMYGERDVDGAEMVILPTFHRASSPAPFIVTLLEPNNRISYHVWFFGLTSKLPISWDCERDRIAEMYSEQLSLEGEGEVLER